VRVATVRMLVLVAMLMSMVMMLLMPMGVRAHWAVYRHRAAPGFANCRLGTL
jgi:hypothetical protein